MESEEVIDNSFFGNYGVESGYGQTTAGRDVRHAQPKGQPGRPRTANPVIQNAIQPTMANPMVEPFHGARQTIGARSPREEAIARGGVTGPGYQPSFEPTQAPPADPAPDYSQFGQFGYGSLDMNKVMGGHDSPKYQISRVLSHFDPKQGITPEALSALNSLGLGTFSGEGDKLSVGGQLDPRFNGITGSDMVKGFKTGNGVWGNWGDSGTGPGAIQGALRGNVPVSNPYLDPNVMTNAILSSGLPNAQDYTARMREQILAALQGGL